MLFNLSKKSKFRPHKRFFAALARPSLREVFDFSNRLWYDFSTRTMDFRAVSLGAGEGGDVLWYLILCAVLLSQCLLCAHAQRLGRSAQRPVLWVCGGILWLFMALRAETVGVDTKYYRRIYEQFSDIPLHEFLTANLYPTRSSRWVLSLEPGYRLLNAVFSRLLFGGQWLTVLTASATIGLLCRWIDRDSPDRMLSIYLYVTLGIFQTEMNVSRNAIAILMVYCAFFHIRRRQPLRFAAKVLIAASFHRTALIFLPLYGLSGRLRLTCRQMLCIAAAGGLLGLAYPSVSGAAAVLLPDGLSGYFSTSNSRMESVAVGAFYAVLFCCTLAFLSPQERAEAQVCQAFGLLMLSAAFCLYGLNLGLHAAARMAALFAPYSIVLLPRLLRCIRCPRKRAAATQWILLLSSVQYMARLLVNNIGGTMPYRFFWQEAIF